MTADKTIIQFPDRRRRRDDETAFLPAALEVVETPPSPIGRAVGGTIIMLFCAALAWASLGKVDVVATAPGKIVVNGRTKVIQPAETGVVRAIHVGDGARVKAGDVLIELDPTINAAELDHVKSDLAVSQLDVARLRAALSPGDPIAQFTPPAGASRQAIEMNRQFLTSQTAEHIAMLSEIDKQLAQKEAERETIAATISKLDATIPLLEERVNIRKYLYDKAIGSGITYLTEAQDLVGQQHDVLIEQSRMREAEAAVAGLAQGRSKVEAEYRRTLYDDLSKAEQRAAGLAQDVIKAEQKVKLQILTAPIDGVVQQLAVHTIGGVVTPAQTLAAVVSLDPDFEIEAMISNRDIGFVVPGQSVAIKIDTFNFTRYGLLHGRVLSISRDAITRDRREEGARDQPSGAETASSEPIGQELVYAARVSLDRTDMEIDGRTVQLSPGMAVTVEIRTGSRRIISYLLSPLMRYNQEVLRER
ncbi:HlyD family type I secretion periplasmic adaptor subunit [Labrys miyagiensis]|uniref:Membrane fusion protein (MFP) family protein n=1 Tax=Labrys miyagiensis TaxID=346912 RepID=A0ABQ6CHX9_9HYPH|nr:HlyD family type I secretion periplasmic adaptor subunit [Labrys miyagiensis]GLS17856.1 HlyD family type I secretion periplasmic adaptor subunit [Labrys miyagiensis]